MNETPLSMPVLVTEGWDDYRLVDFGHGRKLERFGPHLIDRPEEQAMGAPLLPAGEWQKADAVFDGDAEDKEGRWRLAKGAPENFALQFENLKFWGRFTPFRHMGFFPEQAAHWRWMERRIKARGGEFRLLNLFGYTGLASLIAAKAGAHVTHIDASKKAIAYARENQELSGLADKPIRWITEDAVTFVQREQRRGNTYDGILLDPPKFGRGPNNETWHLFENLPAHAEECISLLSDQPSFFILTAYAIRASALSLHSLLAPLLKNRGGDLQSGELAVQAQDGRLLSTSLFSRWSDS
ncbi:MAG: class I SAM-dependent methyltransferase [Pseudomonadota bacterium]